MDEDIVNFILSEVDEFRARQNRELLQGMNDEYEPLQFVEATDVDLGMLVEPEEEHPGSTEVPFVLYGDSVEQEQEFGLGVWNLSLN